MDTLLNIVVALQVEWPSSMIKPGIEVLVDIGKSEGSGI